MDRLPVVHGFWFPDGKSIVFTANEPSRPPRAYRQDVAGGAPKPFLAADMSLAAMSPDGQTILGRDASGAWQFYPVSGGAPRAAQGLTPADAIVCWEGGSLFVRRTRTSRRSSSGSMPLRERGRS